MCMFFLLSSVFCFFWFLLVLVSTLSFFILCPNPAPQWKVMLAPSEGSEGANLSYHVAMLSHQLIPNLEHLCNRCCWSNAFSIAIITQIQSTGIITGHNHYHDIWIFKIIGSLVLGPDLRMERVCARCSPSKNASWISVQYVVSQSLFTKSTSKDWHQGEYISIIMTLPIFEKAFLPGEKAFFPGEKALFFWIKFGTFV